MYSKLDASRLRQDFWTAFGQYMAPVPSAEGLKVNWINYKTGVKNFRFAMDAGTREASVMIVIHHPEEDMRRMYYAGWYSYSRCSAIWLAAIGFGRKML